MLRSDDNPTVEGGLYEESNRGLFVSLDGVTESPGRWQLPCFDDEMAEAIAAAIAAADAMLLGRVHSRSLRRIGLGFLQRTYRLRTT
jgi:hypothetical protein